MRTILEYSEEQRCFHYNTIINGSPKNKENSNGFKTLMYCKNDKEASLFADFLQMQFIERAEYSIEEMLFTIRNLQQFLSAIKNKNP